MSEEQPESAPPLDDDGDLLLEAFDRDVVAATGRVVRIRPTRADDVPALRRFYDALGERSTYFRFFGLRPALLDEQLHPPGGQDIRQRVVLVAVDDDAVIGVGEYWVVPGGDEAEVAFAVADRHQHEGIATLLLEDLTLLARVAGLRRLVAETLAGNDAMRRVFATVGLTDRTWYESGQVHVELDLAATDLLEDQADGRDWTAAVASIRPLLAPSHIVVIGAGRNPASPGRAVLDKLTSSFTGRISVVHPAAPTVGGLASVPGVGELDAVPDLAVVAVPALAVNDIVEACGRRGVGAVVVLSAGFADVGGDGLARERRLLDTARRFGMRVLGPNSLGVAVPASGLDATFLVHALEAGSMAIVSQSGGVGVVLAAEAARRGLGVSSFVSMGNKADVSGNDVLRACADDPSTAVIVMHLESIGDPARFARIARTVSRRIPIVALKSGRAEAARARPPPRPWSPPMRPSTPCSPIPA